MPAEAFEVGERASRERDGEKRICEIIERKQLPNGQWTYYVHFEGLNRRLDSWVQAEELQPIEAQAPNEAGRRPTRQDAVNSRRATRNMKRKIDEINASSLDNLTEHDEAMEVVTRAEMAVTDAAYWESLCSREHEAAAPGPCRASAGCHRTGR